MNAKANPEMLVLAREVRGLTQKDLAHLSGIDQGRISRYEGGIRDIPQNELQVLSNLLNFPVPFFLQNGRRLGPETGDLFHRKRKTATALNQKKIDGLMNIYRMGVEQLLNDIDLEAPFTIPQIDIYGSNGDIEHIAALVRATWRMPSGPVRNLIAQLEAASCMIFRIDFGTDLIDEAVQWVKPLPPIILVNSRASGDRLRFSLAHALGHLVMHHNETPYAKMEDEADNFASAFLMPADDIIDEITPVTIDHLLQLKPYWKVSMQALVHRAKDIGIITERRFTSLYQMLSRAGYRKNEPFPILQEQPEQIKALLTMYREDLRYSDMELASLVRLSLQDFHNWYEGKFTQLTLVPKIK